MNTIDLRVIHARLPKIMLAAIFAMTWAGICTAERVKSSEIPAAISASDKSAKFPEEPAMSASELDELSTTELDELRGKNGGVNISVSGTQQLNATVTGSSFTAGAINGGSVTFAERSLDNFSGIGLFNIVTGNNNAVDSAVGVTFNLQ